MDLIKFLLLHQLLLVFFFNWLLIGFIVLNCLLHRSPAKKRKQRKKHNWNFLFKYRQLYVVNNDYSHFPQVTAQLNTCKATRRH